MKQLPAEGQQDGAAAVGEEAEVADADEAAGEKMQQEAAHELLGGQDHESLPVAVSGVTPSEGDVAVFKCNESRVGDGDAMGVRVEIAERVFRSAERAFGVYDPVVTIEGSQPCPEGARFGQMREAAVELEIAGMKHRPEPGDKLAAEDATKHADGEKEAAGRTDPSVMIGSQSAGGHDAMYMGVQQQSLIPTVQDAEEADLGSEMARIAGDFEQRLSAGMEQQVEEDLLVLQRHGCEFARQSEDRMHVACGQQFLFPRLEPAQASAALTARAMPITAGVIRDGDMAAVGAAIAVTTQCSGAAAQDGQQNLTVLPGDPAMAAVQEGVSGAAYDIGHLQRQPVHLRAVRPPAWFRVSASRGLAVARRCRVDRCKYLLVSP